MTRDTHMPAAAVCSRYDVTNRTLARWEQDPELGFPQPLRINGRRYWREAELAQWERARRGALGASGKPAQRIALSTIMFDGEDE